MNPERQSRVDQLVQEALELDEQHRSEFLQRQCAGDENLRAEVESLLAFGKDAEEFMQASALQVAAEAFAAQGAALQAPEQREVSTLEDRIIAHYRVLSKLGSGGMGVVYKAEDLRVGRYVALKLLLESHSSNNKVLQRFQHEARAIASLNHPNVCTLYEVEEYEGKPVIVMELLEGDTLKQRIKSGRVALPEVLQWGTEVADALATAHAADIIHRDIKPANIFITSRKLTKVLDFGLAKASLAASGPSSPIFVEESLTSLGVIPGTIPYMSPEQIRGEELDGRTDLFSLGAVLYEMATGQRAFAQKNVALIMDAVLNVRPAPVTQINPELPKELEQIIERALEKDRALRYQSAAELHFDLNQLKHGTDSGRMRRSRAVGAAPVPGGSVSATVKVWRIVTPVLSVAVLVAGGFYYRSQRTKPLTDKDTIVLADFSNSTGDPVFDDTLRQGLSVQLEQSPFLSLIPERRVNETLKLMGRPAGERLTPETAREVCMRTGGTALLTGSIASLDNQYVMGLKAVNCNTGDVLAESQEQAVGKEEVLKALDAAALSMRKKLGESLSTVEKYFTPLREATTPSLDALKIYSLGMRTVSSEGQAAAMPFLLRTVDLDPTFAEAYASISTGYAGLNQAERAADYARKAYEMRSKVSEVERFAIETNYYEVATREPDKAAQLCELWRASYPRDARPLRDLGFMYSTLGSHEKALQAAREALQLGPHTAGYYFLLGHEYASVNRFDEAEATYAEAEQRKMEDESLVLGRFQLAFVTGNTVWMDRLAADSLGKPGTEDLLLASEGDTEAWYGRFKSARELTQRAIDSASRNDAKESAALYQAMAALREAEIGNRELARASVQAASTLALNRDIRCVLALALARIGDVPRAKKLVAELQRRYPQDVLARSYWQPSVRAAISLRQNDPNRAIELLKPAGMVERSTEMLRNVPVFLVPAYLRGEAYLALHDGTRAAAEFKKLDENRGLVGNFLGGALARLGLARAYALQEDTTKAHSMYLEFFTLWNDADPDIPILKQAKTEYAKLQ